MPNRSFGHEKYRWKEAHGTARFQGEKTINSLQVNFFWLFACGYHAFALDQKDYGYTLMTGPSHDFH